MGRVGHGPSLYGPSWLLAAFVMGRVCYGPRCPVTLMRLRVVSALGRFGQFWCVISACHFLNPRLIT